MVRRVLPESPVRMAAGAVVVTLLAVCLAHRVRASEIVTDQAGIELFERRIRPLLAERCYECHSQARNKSQGGLQVDVVAALLAGGDSGPAIVPGKPDESLLIAAIRHADGLEMPPEGRLPAAEIALLTEWVERGAPMPHGSVSGAVPRRIVDFDAGRRHWAFQPLHGIAPPTVADGSWVKRPIDAFVLAALEQRGLSPSPPADRRTLLRRASFDLIGLPPTAEEKDAFDRDRSPDAYERAVERLLASPHYGERWGRHWLDLARYADKPAAWDADTTKGQAWLYRDWVVQALNEDMPYDVFVRRQLAADKMPGSVPGDRVALGFLGVSPVYWKELQLDKELIKGVVADEWEERIDAVGRTFLGLSLACARCHDHKYDPVSAEDYYALAGVLASTRLVDLPIIPDVDAKAVSEAKAQVAVLAGEIKKLEQTQPPPPEVEKQVADAKAKIAALERTPGFATPVALGVADAAIEVTAESAFRTRIDYKPGQAIDVNVQIRGSPSNLGPVVPRRFLTVLSAGDPARFHSGSGRLELADSIVTTAAPLAARVFVNRVWNHHFGRGIVDTVSDFGTQGSQPTHPELLTDLAWRFVTSGWSLKWLHREVMLSATYRQASGPNLTCYDVDPDNTLLWRMTRRRLDIEAWRDAILAVAGNLERRVGGPPASLIDPANVRRTLYGTIDRYGMDDVLRLYDFPDSFTHSPLRLPTITPLQQLFVLNGPLVQRQAAVLATRIAGTKADVAASTGDRIRLAYRLVFGRQPTESEMEKAIAFLGEQPGEAAWPPYVQALLGSNEFFFVD
jgi:hypothetical protein